MRNIGTVCFTGGGMHGGIIEEGRSGEVGWRGRSAIYPVCFDVGMDVAFRSR